MFVSAVKPDLLPQQTGADAQPDFLVRLLCHTAIIILIASGYNLCI
jgi:hypothetical protein